MQIINIHEAKTHLSRLIDGAARGESFVIAKAGKPMVKVVAVDCLGPSREVRLGFLAGQVTVPDDFDRMEQAQIEEMFQPATNRIGFTKPSTL